tara:strand:+ start:100 stop:579 length:480 start_codon:yes stop_codon:yes gene_type:complete
MKLSDLKKMVAEEYGKFLKEQAPPAPPAPPTPPAGPAGGPTPPVNVSPDDIQVDMAGGDAEETLQNIFNMLKSYFEGDEAMTPPVGGPPPPPPGAGPTPPGMPTPPEADMDSGDEEAPEAPEDMDDEEEEIEENSTGPNAGYKTLQEVKRLKKLANIRG